MRSGFSTSMRRSASLPLQVFQRRHVLHGGDDGHDLTPVREDWRRVDDSGDRQAVRELYDDLLGAHGLAAFQSPFRRHLVQRNFTSIRTPEGQHIEDFRLAATGCAEPANNPPRLLIERHQIPRLGVEDQHPHGRDVDQGLQVGPGPVFVAVSAGVDDGRSRLGGEHHEGLFVFRGELPSALLLGQVDVAEALA